MANLNFFKLFSCSKNRTTPSTGQTKMDLIIYSVERKGHIVQKKFYYATLQHKPSNLMMSYSTDPCNI